MSDELKPLVLLTTLQHLSIDDETENVRLRNMGFDVWKLSNIIKLTNVIGACRQRNQRMYLKDR